MKQAGIMSLLVHSRPARSLYPIWQETPQCDVSTFFIGPEGRLYFPLGPKERLPKQGFQIGEAGLHIQSATGRDQFSIAKIMFTIRMMSVTVMLLSLSLPAYLPWNLVELHPM